MLKKRLFISLIALTVVNSCLAKQQSGIAFKKTLAQVTPQNTALVLDLHDVVVNFSINKVWPAFFNLKNKLKFIDAVIKYGLNNKKDRKTIEGYINSADPNNSSAIALINPHAPNFGTINLIKELKAKGFKIFISSNVGEQSYDLLKAQYPDVFNLFDGYYVSNAADNYMKKTNPNFFIKTANLISAKAGNEITQFLFIDNDCKNLKMAEKTDARFYGIMFFNSYQLRKDLKCLGLQIELF